MAQATNEEIQVTLSKLLAKIELVEKKRSSNRKLNFMLTVLILSVFVIFGYGLTKPFREIDLGGVFAGVSHSAVVQQTLSKNFLQVSQDLAPILHKGLIEPLLQDPKLLAVMTAESNTFIHVAEHDFKKNLTPLYIHLIKSQKDFLEEVFPEIKDKAAIDQAMDQLIRIGAPKLRASFLEHFREHVQVLLAIHSKIQNLKNDSLANLPSLEKAVLGVSLELFGRLLCQEGEK